MDSPFEILRIDPDADNEEVDRAYRRRAKETHPDQGGSAEAFKRVAAAYEAITSEDPSDRPEFDPADGDGEDGARSRVEYLNYEAIEDYGWALEDDDLFEKAADAELDAEDHGRIPVEPDESLLEAAENSGFAWPYACRGGACANCAIAVLEGELSMPINHILPPEMLERGIRLSCNGKPTSEEMKVVYNVKHLPGLDELRLPPRPFEQAHSDD